MKLKETIEEYKSASNSDLHQALLILRERFGEDKQRVIEITHHMDNIERDYNNLYEEYKKRISGK
jgi:hypothetical protein